MAKILVVGSRGNVGSKLVPLLIDKKESVRAATSKKDINAAAGAETVYLDLRVSSSYANALEGVDRVYLLSPTGQLDLVPSLKRFIETAAAKKIKVVLQTAMGVDSDDNIPLRQVEILLEHSGTPFVIFRPNWFMDNFHNYWLESIRTAGVIAVPAGEGKTSFIDTGDIAASAASVLTTSEFDGHAYNLTGRQALSYSEAAEILSAVTGKTVKYRPVTGEELIKSMIKAGVDEGYSRFLSEIYVPVAMGYAAAVTDSVKKITGAEPGTFEKYARDHSSLWR